MHKLVSAFFALTVLTTLGASTPSAAQAPINYPWCAVYGGDMGGASNCGFTTLEECRATVSGMGGSCEPNLFYTGRAEKTPKRAYKRANNG